MSVESELSNLKEEVQGLRGAVRELRNTINGNGRIGLAESVRRITGVLFANKDTGSPGMVKDVEDIKRMTAQMRAIWWAVGAAVVLLQALQAFGVIGK